MRFCCRLPHTSVIDSSQVLQSRLFVLGDTGGINAKSIAAASQLATQGHSTDLIIFGDESSEGNALLNTNAAAEFVATSNGTIVQAGAMGSIDLSALDLSRSGNNQDLLLPTGVALLQLHSLAHWVLLPGLFILLAMFVRARA